MLTFGYQHKSEEKKNNIFSFLSLRYWFYLFVSLKFFRVVAFFFLLYTFLRIIIWNKREREKEKYYSTISHKNVRRKSSLFIIINRQKQKKKIDSSRNFSVSEHFFYCLRSHNNFRSLINKNFFIHFTSARKIFFKYDFIIFLFFFLS